MSSLHQAHILVVNHAQEILDLMRQLLEREGYRVSTLANAEQDVSKIVELPPDLIVIDYMWSTSGNEWTLLNLLTFDPRTNVIPVIVCTAALRHVEEMRVHLDRMGIRVIHKPFDINGLLKVISTTLSEASITGHAPPDGLEDKPVS